MLLSAPRFDSAIQRAQNTDRATKRTTQQGSLVSERITVEHIGISPRRILCIFWWLLLLLVAAAIAADAVELSIRIRSRVEAPCRLRLSCRFGSVSVSECVQYRGWSPGIEIVCRAIQRTNFECVPSRWYQRLVVYSHGIDPSCYCFAVVGCLLLVLLLMWLLLSAVSRRPAGERLLPGSSWGSVCVRSVCCDRDANGNSCLVCLCTAKDCIAYERVWPLSRQLRKDNWTSGTPR